MEIILGALIVYGLCWIGCKIFGEPPDWALQDRTTPQTQVVLADDNGPLVVTDDGEVYRFYDPRSDQFDS